MKEHLAKRPRLMMAKMRWKQRNCALFRTYVNENWRGTEEQRSWIFSISVL